MAPLPPNSTSRVWLDYSVGGVEHTMMWRHNAIFAPRSMVYDYLDQYLTALDTDVAVLSVLAVRYSAAGSDLSFIDIWPGSPTYGEGTINAVDAPREYRFEARGISSGRKVSLSQYGMKVALPAEYRIGITVSSVWDAAVTVLQAATQDSAFLSIGNDQVVFKQYVNANNNSYWERKART